MNELLDEIKLPSHNWEKMHGNPVPRMRHWTKAIHQHAKSLEKKHGKLEPITLFRMLRPNLFREHGFDSCVNEED